MDYVVFGIGFGATLLVLGLMIRDLGPRVRYRTPSGPDGVFHAEQLVARVAWVRFCGALGAVLSVAGILFVVTTLICMALTMHDDTAPVVMGTALGVVVLVMALWTWAYFDRFGSYGILPEREVAPPPEPASDPTIARRDGEMEQRPESDSHDEEIAATTADPMMGPPLPEPRVRTPEERLAEASDPIEHDSAEADLDTPSTTRRMRVRTVQATQLHGHHGDPGNDTATTSGEPQAEPPTDSDSAGTTSDEDVSEPTVPPRDGITSR